MFENQWGIYTITPCYDVEKPIWERHGKLCHLTQKYNLTSKNMNFSFFTDFPTYVRMELSCKELSNNYTVQRFCKQMLSVLLAINISLLKNTYECRKASTVLCICPYIIIPHINRADIVTRHGHIILCSWYFRNLLPPKMCLACSRSRGQKQAWLKVHSKYIVRSRKWQRMKIFVKEWRLTAVTDWSYFDLISTQAHHNFFNVWVIVLVTLRAMWLLK